MQLKPGLKLVSAVSPAQLIVIRAPGGDVELACAGAPMTTDGASGTSATEGGESLVVGKRYRDEAGSVELLCTVAGAGPLSVDGEPLSEQAAKPLPSSD
ncbi:hypothetical protein [Rhodococcus sp. X156]|uniref:hypothetical protein n=1 Tax=Rhodococcus sp. X156 TaxID=2499145 RepID=UPI000FDC117F|nr:hypothetical protein [Rhodococcus sp. X156]